MVQAMELGGSVAKTLVTCPMRISTGLVDKLRSTVVTSVMTPTVTTTFKVLMETLPVGVT